MHRSPYRSLAAGALLAMLWPPAALYAEALVASGPVQFSPAGLMLIPHGAAGCPADGDWYARTLAVGTDGQVCYCTASGSPGTWIPADGGDLAAFQALLAGFGGAALVGLADAGGYYGAATELETALQLAGAADAAHLADVGNPHSVTAAQAGADPVGSAAAAAAAHAAALALVAGAAAVGVDSTGFLALVGVTTVQAGFAAVDAGIVGLLSSGGAAMIGFDPAGLIYVPLAANVQAAIAAVDAQLVADAGALTTHIGSADDHTAYALEADLALTSGAGTIGADDTGRTAITGATVDAQIDTVDAGIVAYASSGGAALIGADATGLTYATGLTVQADIGLIDAQLVTDAGNLATHIGSADDHTAYALEADLALTSGAGTIGADDTGRTTVTGATVDAQIDTVDAVIVAIAGVGGAALIGADATGLTYATGLTVQADLGLIDAQLVADAGNLATHIGDTGNPHAVTAVQAGADPTGTAAAAVATHAGLPDPHSGYATDGDLSAHTGATGNVHGLALTDLSVDATAAELDQVCDGAGVTVTAINLGDVTDGGDASALHTHASPTARVLCTTPAVYLDGGSNNVDIVDAVHNLTDHQAYLTVTGGAAAQDASIFQTCMVQAEHATWATALAAVLNYKVSGGTASVTLRVRKSDDTIAYTSSAGTSTSAATLSATGAQLVGTIPLGSVQIVRVEALVAVGNTEIASVGPAWINVED